MDEPRRTTAKILYNGVDATSDISPFIESLEYTDQEDASDSISIVLNNMSMNWLNEWMPELGDKIIPSLYKDGRMLDCGSFVADDVAFSGRPLICDLKAVSSPANEGFKETKKTKTWEGVTVKQVSQEIAGNAGIGLVFDAEDRSIETCEQSKNTDAAFLKTLTEKYGFSMKIYADKIVIIDPRVYEKKNPVATFSESDFSSWSYEAAIGGTYTGAKLTYTETSGKKTNTYQASIGGGSRILQLNEKCSSDAEALIIAQGKLDKENEKAFILQFKLRDAVFLSSTQVISVKDLGKLGGNYYITKVQHTLSNGYEVSVTARKIVDRIGRETEKEEAQKSGQSYTVVSGDTLMKIAKKFYGDSAQYTKIYEANRDVIEARAKKDGKASSNGGYWIYPGTSLVIP